MCIYRLKGDGTHLWPNWLPDEERVDHGFFFAERENADPDCRLKIARTWENIRLFPYPSDETKHKIEQYFPDAIGISYVYHGIRTIVSEKARQLLKPFISSECVFLPMTLEQSPQKYWVLYVTNILDCLDSKQSKFGRMTPKGIRSYHFLEEKLENTYLFRLPGHYEYLDSHDFATPAFLNLVQDLKIHGFKFWECNRPGQVPIVS